MKEPIPNPMGHSVKPEAADDKVNVVLAYNSNFVEHGDADAYNEPPAIVDPVDPGFNPDPTPRHHVGSHDPVVSQNVTNGDMTGRT